MEELARRVDRGFAEEICTRPGFVSYEFIDCGDGEIVTVSLFAEVDQAESSRQLAQQWTDENLDGLEFHRIESLNGRVMVSRAAHDMLEPGHVQATGKFGSLRRYTMGTGSIAALMHTVDERFADQIAAMDGFEAYHALDCGGGSIMSISLFRDQDTAEESDERALDFVQQHLSEFRIERTELIGGQVYVSRAVAGLLEPAHA
jgi:hypothetical protein